MRPVSDAANRTVVLGAAAFDAFYYANCCGRPYARTADWLTEFGRIADRIVSDFRPARVMDAGCAIGLLVETLRDRGVEAWGVDISDHAMAQVPSAVAPFCRVGSIADSFGERFDLITCIEVVEHMPPPEADRSIANLCAHADVVLFSSSPVDYREPTHVNVHPPEHWAELFARHGFVRDADYDASYVTPWAGCFRRTTQPMHRIVRDLERAAWLSKVGEREARAYATDVQARASHAEAEVKDVRAAMDREVASLRQTLAQAEAGRVAAETSRGQAERALDEARAALRAARAELEAARATIHNMEQSLFWKLRRVLGRK
jgi:2-polyprenyl-3-methyl-5-hydroxy-6-metoxy-1,4-benzoquinol methylase